MFYKTLSKCYKFFMQQTLLVNIICSKQILIVPQLKLRNDLPWWTLVTVFRYRFASQIENNWLNLQGWHQICSVDLYYMSLKR